MNEAVKEAEALAAPVVNAQTSIEQVTKQLENRVVMLDRIHTLLQQRIEPARDLKKIGGQFRRTINFARVCRRVLGGDITYRRDPKTDLPYRRADYKDDAGDFYVYTCSCVWRLPWGEEIEGVSLVSSRDPFFGVADDDYKGVSEVNESHIAQKSVTEAFKQAVFVGLGFPKDVTDDEMAKYGLKADGVAGHDFAASRGNSGGSKDGSQETKDKRALIEAGCRQLFQADWKSKSGEVPKSAEDVLRMVTQNPDQGWGGWKKFSGISEKSLSRTLNEINAAVESHLGPTQRDPIDELNK